MKSKIKTNLTVLYEAVLLAVKSQSLTTVSKIMESMLLQIGIPSEWKIEFDTDSGFVAISSPHYTETYASLHAYIVVPNDINDIYIEEDFGDISLEIYKDEEDGKKHAEIIYYKELDFSDDDLDDVDSNYPEEKECYFGTGYHIGGGVYQDDDGDNWEFY